MTAPVTCMLCGSHCESEPVFSINDRLKLDTKTYAVFRCTHCHSIMLNPLPNAEDLERLYPDTYNFKISSNDRGIQGIIKQLEWHLFYRRSYLRSYRMIRRVVKKPVFSLLDVGCGSGLRLQVFKEKGCNVEGNDISESCIRYIREVVQVPAHKGRLEDIDLHGKTYDVVTMFALVEHLVDPLTTIKAAAQKVSDGGILVVQAPSVDSFQYKFLGKKAGMIRDMPRHIYIPSIKGMVAIMEKAGFTLEKIKPHTVLDSAALFAFGLFPGASTANAYKSSLAGMMFRRLTGWLLALVLGIPVGISENIRGRGVENFYVFRKCSR